MDDVVDCVNKLSENPGDLRGRSGGVSIRGQTELTVLTGLGLHSLSGFVASVDVSKNVQIRYESIQSLASTLDHPVCHGWAHPRGSGDASYSLDLA